MVKEIGIQGIQIGQGSVVVDTKLQTDKGLVGMRVALLLDKGQEELCAAVDMLEKAVERAMVDSIGIAEEPTKEPAAKPS